MEEEEEEEEEGGGEGGREREREREREKEVKKEEEREEKKKKKKGSDTIDRPYFLCGLEPVREPTSGKTEAWWMDGHTAIERHFHART